MFFRSNSKIISRGKGKSAVAAAAYRAGEKLTNDFDGETHDYTHKGGVVHTEILLPGHAPAAFSDRAVLWNAVEKIEKAKNDYLKGVMNGKTALPVKAWKAEYAKLTAERKTLNRRYLALKEEVKEAEQIRKSVYNILRQEQREQQPRRAQDMER